MEIGNIVKIDIVFFIEGTPNDHDIFKKTDHACFWRPQFFGPNSETCSQAAHDMYLAIWKVSEFLPKNCNLHQGRCKINMNGNCLNLPTDPRKASQSQTRSALIW